MVAALIRCHINTCDKTPYGAFSAYRKCTEKKSDETKC